MRNSFKVTEDEIFFSGDRGSNANKYILGEYNHSAIRGFEIFRRTEQNNEEDKK